MKPSTAFSAGSRKVEPRKRKRSPSTDRRDLRRSLGKVVSTANLIQGTSKKRQRTRAAGEANAATGLDTDLFALYDAYGDARREVFATGLVNDGAPYKGRTWRSS